MLCVIGCGNCTRSDDGVGVVVAQALQGIQQRDPQPNIRVFDAGTGGMDVMFKARGAEQLIVVDAVRSGAQPGAIFRVPGHELECAPATGFTLHDFRWQHALTAGRKIFGGEFPREVTVFLVEAASLDFGLELSAPVAIAARRVVAEISAMMRAYRESTVPAEVSVARGNLYLSRATHDAYLADADSVALRAREHEILILPLRRESAGGLLLKQRNARGDRVIHAREFFRAHELPEDVEPRSVPASWSRSDAALVVSGLVKRP
jgi:hydrogenase maturation protease